MWRADGNELAYIDLDKTTVMTLTVNTERTFQPGTPQPLLKIPADRGQFNTIAATPDLKRFLMPVAVPVKVPQSFMVVFNWSAGLKK